MAKNYGDTGCTLGGLSGEEGCIKLNYTGHSTFHLLLTGSRLAHGCANSKLETIKQNPMPIIHLKTLKNVNLFPLHLNTETHMNNNGQELTVV